MNMNTAMIIDAMVWFHDGLLGEEADDGAGVADEGGESSEGHEWGTCIDCGAGLDDANGFLVDRREVQCDCYTCDACFARFHGETALYAAVNWQTLGLAVPQYIRVCCFE
jgi:hypothetical protein